jgi:hypothetical protein
MVSMPSSTLMAQASTTHFAPCSAQIVTMTRYRTLASLDAKSRRCQISARLRGMTATGIRSAMLATLRIRSAMIAIIIAYPMSANRTATTTEYLMTAM